MKTKTRLFLLGIAIFAVFQSCNITEKVNTQFSKKEYKTDEVYFKVKSFGKSSNLSFAKETALFNAKKDLAEKIYYSKYPKKKGKTKTFEQDLMKLRVVEEKCFVLENGNYECEITLATPKKLY